MIILCIANLVMIYFLFFNDKQALRGMINEKDKSIFFIFVSSKYRMKSDYLVLYFENY